MSKNLNQNEQRKLLDAKKPAKVGNSKLSNRPSLESQKNIKSGDRLSLENNTKDVSKTKKTKSGILNAINTNIGGTSQETGYHPVGSQDDENLKKSTCLAFAILSKENSEELLTMNAVEMESKLKSVFKLNPGTEMRDAAVLDYYVGATYWSKQEGHTPQQLSGFFSVIHILLNKLHDEHNSLVDTFMAFRKMLVGITADLGPEVESGGLEFFSSDQAKAITHYLQTCLFQHFKLYDLMFRQPQTMEIVSNELLVEVPPAADMPFPPPLDEGIAEETYREFLSIPTPNVITVDEPKPQEEKEDKSHAATGVPSPIQVELPAEVKDLFSKLTPEDVKAVVEEVSQEMLQTLQSGVETKMRNYENAVLNRINKIHVMLPDKLEEHTAEK